MNPNRYKNASVFARFVSIFVGFLVSLMLFAKSKQQTNPLLELFFLFLILSDVMMVVFWNIWKSRWRYLLDSDATNDYGVPCCPKCGSTNIILGERKFSYSRAVFGSLLFRHPLGSLLGMTGKKYGRSQCLACGYRWRRTR